MTLAKKIYITPVTKVHSTFKEAADFQDQFGGVTFFDDEKQLAVTELAQGTRNLIVGEPGVGKSLFLNKLKKHLIDSGNETKLINLRQPNCETQIDNFIALKFKKPKALLLDALDEVQSINFSSVLQKIEKISTEYPNLQIYLSSRWVFITRYTSSFPGYRFITICPFTQSQVREYLIKAGHEKSDVNGLLQRVMSFNHKMLVLQIPRYLYFLEDFLKKNDIETTAKISRNDLFDYFIYSKLEYEDKKLKADKKAIIKRVLEKLALTMEIYQTNVISKDELMTFFDELNSDLKLIALSQVDLEVFFDYSLLKNNVDSVEFDNTEFQEYLAAKEITRMPDPNHAAFDFAVDKNIKEIYPSWFNALTFLVDMQKDLLNQLIDFSGMRRTDYKILDEGFLVFLSRIDIRNINSNLRTELFHTVINYHHKTRQWLPGNLASTLPLLFDPKFEKDFKSQITKFEKNTGSARFVPLGNIAYVVAYLLHDGIELDRSFWKKKLIEYASDKNENGVLQRHALLALEYLGDATVIDKLPNLLDSEDLISQAFLSMCTELDPDNPRSLEYFIEAIRRDDFHGRYGLIALKKSDSIKSFLNSFNTDIDFRQEFLDDSSIFGDRDHVLVNNIKNVLDDEIKKLCMEALVQSVNIQVAHAAVRSLFLIGLAEMLRSDNKNFISDLIDQIKNIPDGKNGFYFAHGFFEAVMESSDVVPYINKMIEVNEKWSALSVMQHIKLSNKKNANTIYEAGRDLLANEYGEWEKRLAQPDTSEKDRNTELLKEFRMQLEPSPGKFMDNVFSFYNRNKDQLELLLIKADKDCLKKLITGTIFQFVDPTDHDLKITDEKEGSKSFTTNKAIFTFGEAIITAKHLGIGISEYRQNIINFIPFAYDNQLETIFEMIEDINSNEMKSVIAVYRDKKSDLWRHQPISFINTVEKYHFTEAVPILRELTKELACDTYTRQKALTVAESLSPDSAFLIKLIKDYKNNTGVAEKKLIEVANALLITSHNNKNAISWRMKEIIKRVAPLTQLKGVRSINDLVEEVRHGKSFAKPLMELKYKGYENDYLKLLDDAMITWNKGKEYQEYTSYIWEIIYSYFDNLKNTRSYKPLHLLESKISEIKDHEGANWLASRMMKLRRSYLSNLGKPRNISDAVKQYNDARKYHDKRIIDSEDLFQQLQDTLESDLKQWIEGEGAYDLIIGEKVYDTKKQEYEKLVQRTLKTQVDNALLKRGFRTEIMREPELLDGKKVDFFVRYGFIGPVVVEVKLTSNSDMKLKDISKSSSYISMERYMQGYYATHGILLVIKNDNAKNIHCIKKSFQKITNVSIKSFDCYGSVFAKQSTKKKVAPKKKTSTKPKRKVAKKAVKKPKI